MVALVYVGACATQMLQHPLSQLINCMFFFLSSCFITLPTKSIIFHHRNAMSMCNPMGYDRPECLYIHNLVRPGAPYLFTFALSRGV